MILYWGLGTGYWVLGYFVLALASASGFLGRRSVKTRLGCLLPFNAAFHSLIVPIARRTLSAADK